MRVYDQIVEKMTTGLAPARLELVDESDRHKGHAGHRPEGETHFHLTVVSDAFTGLSRVARQKRVYNILADELAGPVHALTLTTLTPEEDLK